MTAPAGGVAGPVVGGGSADVVRSLADVLGGGVRVLLALLSSPLLRRRRAVRGATPDEVAGEMPGDDLVPVPVRGYTRAVTVGAPVERVWPWLAQIGQGRAGLYSYDGLENLVGCRIRSLRTLLPAEERLQPGDLVRLGPEGYPCFRVHTAEPPGALVLVSADPRPPHRAGAVTGDPTVATWQWVLRPERGGRATRVVVRQRLVHPRSQALLWRLVEPVGYVMEQRMLRGLAARAEQR
ncbi:hypothetical protein E9549_07700 [Blastococcus sp. MG754426]|uniref:hypothetical protein n=1 Tax=unclassified Blastococcus TaxID=2619396 RepID=UPI001EF09700|nr:MULTISPECIES: hypothetical protein [unclassified Blastococcus]MCF6507291.1 hypothetical protein [Blastococcus sp. MG754426]MCF6510777.1 hypothetical protein [Blastococcus sp. MG754427]MCF6734341.1 hypothetical protein [Blastococcus sp. KM273129]